MKIITHSKVLLFCIYLLIGYVNISNSSAQTNSTGTTHSDKITDNKFAKEPQVIKAKEFYTTVELKGKIITELHYGEPGFGEDTTNDKKVYPFIIVLENKINVEWESGFKGEINVEKIQLAFPYEKIEELRKLKNKKVTVTGKLYHWDVATQYTPILIDVIKIDEL